MSKTKFVGKILLVVAMLAASGVVTPVHAATFQVTTAADTVDATPGDGVCADASGYCSLRAAITEANRATDTDTITFNITGTGVQRITLSSALGALPSISQPVIIDGTTQPGANCDAWLPTLLIELNAGSLTGTVYGLDISAGGSTVRGLVINGFPRAGIRLATNNSNTITCNYLGTNTAGSATDGNLHGILISNSDNNVIGGTGTTQIDRNLISGNVGSGVRIDSDSTGNQIQGNYIGTNASGDQALGNVSAGVWIEDEAASNNTSGNTIGGSLAGERNIISGNDQYGVWLDGSYARSNIVGGNYIGTDASGTEDLGNGSHGVYINGAPSNTIGQSATTGGNLVSGNNGSGVRIDLSTASGNVVRGNYIGLQADGISRLDNGISGVYIQDAPDNTIGGTTETARNVISGNTGSGVYIRDSNAIGNEAQGNDIQGNYIGTQANGTSALGNTGSAVHIENVPNSVVGGSAAGARNILSSNALHGVYIGGENATGNFVRGNYIGTGSGGTGNLGNGEHGVFIRLDSSGNEVGGQWANEPNVIAYNGLDGIFIDAATDNLISHNSIHSNTGLGIDLAPDGITPNDDPSNLDGDTGANNLQNFPVLSSVTVGTTSTTIQGSLDSAASTQFILEFFYSTADDPLHYGEGAVYIGSYTANTDSSGHHTINQSFPTTIPSGSYVSATATDPNKNTSEFGPVSQAPTAVLLSDLYAYPRLRGIMLEWTTVVELETLGFNLYRAEQVDGARTKLNDILIPSGAPGSPSGAHYTWGDGEVTSSVTYYYWLEDIDIYGVGTLHGPVSATVANYGYYLPLLNR